MRAVSPTEEECSLTNLAKLTVSSGLGCFSKLRGESSLQVSDVNLEFNFRVFLERPAGEPFALFIHNRS